jgi:hypothetical protein
MARCADANVVLIPSWPQAATFCDLDTSFQRFLACRSNLPDDPHSIRLFGDPVRPCQHVSPSGLTNESKRLIALGPVCVRDAILDRDDHISVVDSNAAMPLLIVPVKRNEGRDELRENASTKDLGCIQPGG